MKPSELLEKPEAWCRGHQAVDAQGRLVQACSPSAVAWCVNGAIQRCAGDGGGKSGSEEHRRYREGSYRLSEHLQCAAFLFNDDPNTTHAEVIAALQAVGL